MNMTATIQEQISPRILETLFANFPSAEIAILELTDNAIGDRIAGEKMVLTVRIRPSSIKVINKGGYGMGIDDLRSFITWGESRPTGVFRFFGQGGKAAIGYLGKKFKVTAFPKGGDRLYIIEEREDWTSRPGNQLKNFPVREESTITFDSGVVQVEIYDIVRRVNVRKLRSLLRATYGKLIELGDLQILFNDKWLSPEPIECRQPITMSELTGYGTLRGWLGINDNGHGGGIRCYSQNRLITNKETFGLDPIDYDLSKLIGEVFLDFVPVMPNKISYDTSSKEWEVVEAIVVGFAGPLLEQIKGISEVPPSLQKMAKDLSDFINKALLAADSDYESRGRKSPEDISVVTLVADEGERKRRPGVAEPRTPAEADNTGETTRLGFLDVRLQRMETETVRCRIEGNNAELNINFPMAKLFLARPYKKAAYYAYALESVAMEYYRNKVASPSELTDKVNNILSRSLKVAYER